MSPTMTILDGDGSGNEKTGIGSEHGEPGVLRPDLEGGFVPENDEENGQKDGQRVETSDAGGEAVGEEYWSGSTAVEKVPTKEKADRKKETAAKKEQQSTVPFIRLFSFADKYDYLLMFFGSVGAVVHGAAIPIFLLFFGKVLNGLGGQSGAFSKNTVDKVRHLVPGKRPHRPLEQVQVSCKPFNSGFNSILRLPWELNKLPNETY